MRHDIYAKLFELQGMNELKAKIEAQSYSQGFEDGLKAIPANKTNESADISTHDLICGETWDTMRAMICYCDMTNSKDTKSDLFDRVERRRYHKRKRETPIPKSHCESVLKTFWQVHRKSCRKGI